MICPYIKIQAFRLVIWQTLLPRFSISFFFFFFNKIVAKNPATVPL